MYRCVNTNLPQQSDTALAVKLELNESKDMTTLGTMLA